MSTVFLVLSCRIGRDTKHYLLYCFNDDNINKKKRYTYIARNPNVWPGFLGYTLSSHEYYPGTCLSI